MVVEEKKCCQVELQLFFFYGGSDISVFLQLGVARRSCIRSNSIFSPLQGHLIAIQLKIKNKRKYITDRQMI
jgi:hypothetical protein